MISRSRAIVKDLKSMKNLGWLTNSDHWILLLKKHLPRALASQVEAIRLPSLEKTFLRGYRWVKLSRDHAELIVPQRFLNLDLKSGHFSHAAILDAALVMVRGFVNYSAPFENDLTLAIDEINFHQEDNLSGLKFVRLMTGWSSQEREKTFFNLRSDQQTKTSFQVEVMDSHERILAHIELKVKLSTNWKQKISARIRE